MGPKDSNRWVEITLLYHLANTAMFSSFPMEEAKQDKPSHRWLFLLAKASSNSSSLVINSKVLMV